LKKIKQNEQKEEDKKIEEECKEAELIYKSNSLISEMKIVSRKEIVKENPNNMNKNELKM
jgi:hypothetical protein